MLQILSDAVALLSQQVKEVIDDNRMLRARVLVQADHISRLELAASDTKAAMAISQGAVRCECGKLCVTKLGVVR